MNPHFDPAAIGLVIFDFDGIVLESADIKTDAFPELFAEHPAHQDAIRAYHLAHQGISRFKKFEWIYAELLRQPLDAATSQALGEGFSALVMEKILAAPFVPGARELLDLLKARGLPMVIVSGTPQGELDDITARRGLRHYFEAIVGSPTEKPVAVRALLERHRLAPQQAVFLGDGLSDHKAAVATGVHFVGRRTASAPGLWDDIPLPSLFDDLKPLLAWDWPRQAVASPR